MKIYNLPTRVLDEIKESGVHKEITQPTNNLTRGILIVLTFVTGVIIANL